MTRWRVDCRGSCTLRGAALNNMRVMARTERMNWNQQIPDLAMCRDLKELDTGRAFPADKFIAPLTDLAGEPLHEVPRLIVIRPVVYINGGTYSH